MLALLLLLALAVRLINLNRLELWHDEACTVLTATSPQGVWQELRTDTNAPLYFLLMRPWIEWAGVEAWAVRLPSALFGVATVAFLGFWVRRCGASWRTALWAMALCTLVPMQLRFSEEARGYTLVCLLEVIALWAYVRAVDTGRVYFWLVHGLALFAGMYTHNLMVPLIVGFWIATAMARAPLRVWIALALIHTLTVVAYFPCLLLMLGQVRGSGGTGWIKVLWDQYPPWLAMPRSWVAMGLAGAMPPLAQSHWPLLAWRFTTFVVMIVAAALAFWPSRTADPNPPTGWREFGRHRGLILVFALWPLLVLFGYSLVRQPIYVVGRYDILAQPAYLALLACGLSRLHGALGRNSQAWGRPLKFAFAGFVLMLPTVNVVGRWVLPDEQLSQPRHTLRGALLQELAAPHDLVVCLGLEGAGTKYQVLRGQIPVEVITFPRDTLSHLGWIASGAALDAQMPQQPAEAAAIFDQASRAGCQHVWVVLDQYAYDGHRYQLPDPHRPMDARHYLIWLLTSQAAAQRGWVPWRSPGYQALLERGGIVGFERSP